MTRAGPSERRPRFRMRSVVLAVTGAIAILGLVPVVASAASLGGVRTDDLGATTGTVGDHVGGIGITWGAARTLSSWQFVRIDLTAADRFASGERVRVTLVGTTGAALCELSFTASSSTTTLSMNQSDIEKACGKTLIDMAAIASVAITAGG